MSGGYRCLNCGSTSAEPIPDNPDAETWYHRNTKYGRIGPLCSYSCAMAFRFPRDQEPRFTRQEMDKLLFVAWRAEREVLA